MVPLAAIQAVPIAVIAWYRLHRYAWYRYSAIVRLLQVSEDVGMVEVREPDKSGKLIRKQLEVDFVVNQGSQRYYIQSAFAMPTLEKEAQESASLLRIKDSFKKIIIVKDDIKPKRNEDGILTIGLKDFLLDKNSLNY